MTERWVKEVTKAIPRTAKYLPGDPSVSAIEAAKLLARQHREFVEMVKQQHANCNNPCTCCCDALLAAMEATHE